MGVFFQNVLLVVLTIGAAGYIYLNIRYRFIPWAKGVPSDDIP